MGKSSSPIIKSRSWWKIIATVNRNKCDMVTFHKFILSKSVYKEFLVQFHIKAYSFIEDVKQDDSYKYGKLVSILSNTPLHHLMQREYTSMKGLQRVGYLYAFGPFYWPLPYYSQLYVIVNSSYDSAQAQEVHNIWSQLRVCSLMDSTTFFKEIIVWSSAQGYYVGGECC